MSWIYDCRRIMTNNSAKEPNDGYFNPEPSVWDVGDRVFDMLNWHASVRLEVDIPNSLAYLRDGIWRLVTMPDAVCFWGAIKEFSDLCDILTEDGAE